VRGEYDFKPRKNVVKGKTYWRIRVGTNANGSPQWLQCKNEAHAKQEQRKRLALQAEKSALSLEALNISDHHEVAQAIKDLAKIGSTIKEATEWYLKTGPQRFPDKTVEECGELFLKSAKKRNVKQSTYENYERLLKPLIAHFDTKAVNVLTKQDLEQYFDTTQGHIDNPNTLGPRKKFVRTFFGWLQDNGYIHKQDDHAAERLDIPSKDLSTPKLATWHEAQHMLYWYDAEARKRERRKGKDIAASYRGSMVYLVLILFCGVRREEASQVVWKDIDLVGRKIKILVEGAKKRQRRVNDASDNVWQWLFYLRKHNANLDDDGDSLRRLTYHQRKYRESFEKSHRRVPEIVATKLVSVGNGKKEPRAKNQNIMRHSFISYHMKFGHSATETAELAGNSEKQVLGTYKEMVTSKLDAKLWFAIKPPETVSLKAAIDGHPVDLDTAYESQVQIKLLRNALDHSTDDSQKLEILEALQNHATVTKRYEQEVPDNIHKLAKRYEWGEHDPRAHFNEDGEPFYKYDDFSESEWDENPSKTK
jgi:site-specific recombinase XerD